jgi:hypothetical protein
MDKELLDFFARIAWPLVAFAALLILGPFGALDKIIKGVVENLVKISGSINDFRAIAEDFNKTERQLKESASWVSTFGEQVRSILASMDSTNIIVQQLMISVQQLKTSAASSPQSPPAFDEPDTADTPAQPERLSADHMFNDIRDRWEDLVEKLKARVGPDQFDARSVGQMARKLVDRRFRDPLDPADAELIEQLHSQVKRFNRLQSNKEEWLTQDIYSAFVSGVKQAAEAL